MKPNIGIAITGYNRPNTTLNCVRSIISNLDTQNYNHKVVLVLDTLSISGFEECLDYCDVIVHEHSGISINRSIALIQLKACDFIFLIEDDVEIVKSGFESLYINIYKDSKIELFNFYPEFASKPIKEVKYSSGTIIYEPGHVVQIMFITSNALNKLGVLDPRYKEYGFEHVDYTERYNKLFNQSGNPIIKESREYIKLQDVKSSLSKEEINNSIKLNSILFSDKKTQRLFIPFEEINNYTSNAQTYFKR